MHDVVIIKKDGTEQSYDINKVVIAVGKSAARCMHILTEDEIELIKNTVLEMSKIYADEHDKKIPIAQMHIFAELALDKINPDIAKSYRDYRNYKVDFRDMFDDVYNKSLSIRYIGDVSNANTDSSMVSTQRSLIYGKLNKELYKKFFLNKDELQAINDGYIYIHDIKDRLDGLNCLARNTKFLTIDGIKSFEDFEDGDKVIAVTRFGLAASIVHSYGIQPLNKVIFCKEDTNETREVHCTANHRWILRDGSTTTNLKVGDKLVETPDTFFNPWTVKDIQPLDSEPEQVWCLSVSYYHEFILEGGIPTGNCCLFDMANVIKNGFEMGNVWYTEPKSLDVAFDVISDVTISAASQQYGGFTIPQVDKLLAPYAEKSYKKYMQEYKDIIDETPAEWNYAVANKYAMNKVRRDMEQGFQSWEMRFNTVGSSRGDYPFIACTFGLDTSEFGLMVSETALKVRMNGQGAEGKKKAVLFPKLSFFYDENLHGEGKEYEWLFDLAIECSSKTMYPDFISLTGEGYIPSIYKKYKVPISLMGCRASLSPWYERGGIKPADENDKPIYEGRFNMGAVSLHLSMILAKARKEGKDFYEVLDYYLELIRKLHLKTIEFLGRKHASTNPMMFMQGGCIGGHLKADDRIKDLLAPMTVSFGIIGLNELQQLYNGKSIIEDGQFALEVMEYINKKANEFKEEDHVLYAIYGTPAESTASLQMRQFKEMYGEVPGVTDHPYMSNSFHCAVWEDITPIEKQDYEKRFWDLFNGGKIQYCRYPIDYNLKAQKDLVRRGMKMGFYEGCNLELCYCEDCGYQEVEMRKCPKCGSENLTIIDRMNGYIGYTRIHNKTRYNEGKLIEISERKSM